MSPVERTSESEEERNRIPAATGSGESEAAGFDAFVQGHLRWNSAVNRLYVVIRELGIAFVAPQTLLAVFVRELSGRDFDVGVIGALWSVGWFLPQLPTAFIVERLRRKKPFVLAVGLIQLIPFLLMGLAVLLVGSRRPGILLALVYIAYSLHTFGAGFFATGWHELTARVIPQGRRGIFFGSAFALGGILRVLGGLLCGQLLLSMTPYGNYGVSFLVAFGITMLSWGFLCQTREPPPPALRPCTEWRSYVRKVRAILNSHANYRRFLVGHGGLILGTMGATFVAVYGRQRFELDLYHVGLMTSALAVGGLVANPLIGHVGDRFGHKRGLELAALAYLAAMALAFAAWHAWVIYLSIFLLGIYYAGRKVSGTIIAFEFGSMEDRPTYVGLSGTLLAPLYGIGPLVGGVLAQAAGYRTLFAVSTLIVLPALVFFVATVKDPRRGGRRPARWEEVDGLPGNP